MSKRYLRVISLLLLLSVLLSVLLLTPQAALSISWKKLDSTRFRIYYEKFSEGKRVLKIAKESYPEIASDLSFEPPGKIKIYVFHHHSLFLKQSPSKQARGYTYPFKNEIFISATRGSLEATLRHEFSHVIFIRSVPDVSSIPFWFIEGLAYYQSRPGISAVDIEAVATERDLPTIRQLSRERPSTEREESQVAVEGYLVVRYIVEVYGEKKLYHLVRYLQRGEEFPQAIRKSLGVTESELERNWKSYASRQEQQIKLTQLRYAGLLALGFLAILAVTVGFWRYRRRLWAMEEEMDVDHEGEDEI